MINDWLVVALLAQAVMAATPLVLAGLGELVAERTGVINIGIEGLVLSGCIAGFATAAITGSAWLGLGAAVLAGAVLAAVFALVAVVGRADQIVTGLGLNLFAVGASGTVWSVLQHHGLTSLPEGVGFTRGWACPYAYALPVVGPCFFNQYGLTAATVILTLFTGWILRQTRLGLVITSLGEAPRACEAAGVGVRRWRFLAVVGAGAAAGAAGAFLAIMRTHSFVPLMSGGLGFVVLALVMFGRWHTPWLVLGCLLFGFMDALQQHVQAQAGANRVPYQLWQMLPYLTALVVLAAVRRGKAGPAALGRPWPE